MIFSNISIFCLFNSSNDAFGITDTSVLIAVIVYATIPATRYTIEGLRSVPTALHDAATMSGVNKFQRLTKIEFPLAFPHMILGLNQTIVFALFSYYWSIHWYRRFKSIYS